MSQQDMGIEVLRCHHCNRRELSVFSGGSGIRIGGHKCAGRWETDYKRVLTAREARELITELECSLEAGGKP